MRIACLVIISLFINSLEFVAREARGSDLYQEGLFLASMERVPDSPVVNSVVTSSFGGEQVRASQHQAGFITQVQAQSVGSPTPMPSPLPCEACYAASPASGASCQECSSLSGKIRYNRLPETKKTIYPIARPYCQPGYGIYETCWRQIQPNNCCYRCQPLPGEHVLPPVPASQPLPGETPESNTAPRPYE